MDGFSKDEDHRFFDHINHQSDDKGVGGPMSPPLQYHQPRCPVDLNLNHLPHYIDRHHFVQQQCTTINQCTWGWHDLRWKNIMYSSNQRIQHQKLFWLQNNIFWPELVCKSHENDCTWSLGACNSKSYKKWIIKSIKYQRSSHLSHAHTQTRSSATQQTRHSTYRPTNCQKCTLLLYIPMMILLSYW